MTHADLVALAERWLWRQNCGVVLCETQTSLTLETPDAIGFRVDASILIECKVTRSDFLADRKKSFREDPALGMGDYRFFLVPAGLVKLPELPDGWGLLEVKGKRVFRSAGGPRGNIWARRDAPLQGNPDAERALLYSIARRAQVKGLMPAVLETITAEQTRMQEEHA